MNKPELNFHETIHFHPGFDMLISLIFLVGAHLFSYTKLPKSATSRCSVATSRPPRRPPSASAAPSGLNCQEFSSKMGLLKDIENYQGCQCRMNCPLFSFNSKMWLLVPAFQATPRLSEDKVRQCVDLRLGGDYPPKAVAKFAAVAALCVQYEADFRPNMSIVVKALQPLLNAQASNHEENAGS